MLGVCRRTGATAPALSIWPLPPASTRQSSGLHPSSALTSPAPFSVSVSVFLLSMVWSFAAPAAGLSCSAQRPDASRSRSWVLGFLHSCMPSVPAIHWSTRRCCRMPMLMLMRGAPLVVYQERGVGGSEAQRRRRLGGSEASEAWRHARSDVGAASASRAAHTSNSSCAPPGAGGSSGPFRSCVDLPTACALLQPRSTLLQSGRTLRGGLGPGVGAAGRPQDASSGWRPQARDATRVTRTADSANIRTHARLMPSDSYAA